MLLEITCCVFTLSQTWKVMVCCTSVMAIAIPELFCYKVHVCVCVCVGRTQVMICKAVDP